MTAKQKVFVAEYLKDYNATQAAIRAGYPAKNADVQGPRLLGFDGVRAAIEARMESSLRAMGVSREFVLSKLVKIAGMDIEKYTGDNQLKSLELIGKYLKMFQDTQVGVSITFDSSPRRGSNRPEGYEERFERDVTPAKALSGDSDG